MRSQHLASCGIQRQLGIETLTGWMDSGWDGALRLTSRADLGAQSSPRSSSPAYSRRDSWGIIVALMCLICFPSRM